MDYFVDTLGFERTAIFPPDGEAGPVYGIVNRDGVEFHLQIRRRTLWVEPREEIESDAYVRIDDVDARYEEHRAAGVTVLREICDEDYGQRDFCIETPDGHRIVFGSPAPD